MGTHACPLPSIWTVLQVKCKAFTCKKKKKVCDIKVVNSMAEHERKTEQCDLRPGQERLHLSVEPKQQTVCVYACVYVCVRERQAEGKHAVKDIQIVRCTVRTLQPFHKDIWPC